MFMSYSGSNLTRYINFFLFLVKKKLFGAISQVNVLYITEHVIRLNFYFHHFYTLNLNFTPLDFLILNLF